MLGESDALTRWESSRAGPDPAVDQAVGHVYGSDGSKLPPLGDHLAGHADWASVASTVYTKLYSIAGFHPEVVTFEEDSFAKLRRFFTTSPYWSGSLRVLSRDIHLSPRDYGPVVETLNDLGKQAEVPADITRLILGNVKRIAQLASRPGEPAQKTSLHHSTTIAVSAGEVRLLFLHAWVPLRMDPDKGRYRTTTATVDALLSTAVLNLDFCKRHADRIRSYDSVGIDDWTRLAAANTEPENDSKGWPS